MRVARIFNTFGPRMHMNDGRVVSNFILQALQGENITVRDTVTDYIGVFIFAIFFWFFQPQPVLSGHCMCKPIGFRVQLLKNFL